MFAEFVEGGSLRDWIADARLYAGGAGEVIERVLDVAIQVAWGLEHAHRLGVVHQDVKPANILVTLDGMAKVTDFGIARMRPLGAGAGGIADPETTVQVTWGGMTPGYAPPEQAEGVPLGRRTDVWSFAVSVLHMLTGETRRPAGPAAGAVLADLHGSGVIHRSRREVAGDRPVPYLVADEQANIPRTLAKPRTHVLS